MTWSTPPRSSWPMRRTISGTCATGSIDLGTTLVSGRSRVPKPPTRTTARISRWSWWWRAEVVVAPRRGRRRARSPTARRRRSWWSATAEPGTESGTLSVGSEPVSTAPSARARRPTAASRCRCRGLEGDRDHEAVLVDADVVEVGHVATAVAGVVRALPDRHRQLAVLAVRALRLALDVLLAALVLRELQRVVVELDAVVLEEQAERGVRADRRRRRGVPVDDAVVVAVDAGAQEVGAHQLAVAVGLLEGAGELDHLRLVAQREAVGDVPVVADRRRRGVGLRLAGAGVDDRSPGRTRGCPG